MKNKNFKSAIAFSLALCMLVPLTANMDSLTDVLAIGDSSSTSKELSCSVSEENFDDQNSGYRKYSVTGFSQDDAVDNQISVYVVLDSVANQYWLSAQVGYLDSSGEWQTINIPNTPTVNEDGKVYFEFNLPSYVTECQITFYDNTTIGSAVILKSTEETTTASESETSTTSESETTDVTTSVPQKDILGYAYPAFQAGTTSQWDNDGSLAEAVAITGNGNYTLTINIPEDGASETIDFFAICTDIDAYQQNALQEEIYADMTFTINSILIDDTPITYTPSSNALGLNDDGATYRMSILDTWSNRNITDIDSNNPVTKSIVVNFTIGGIIEDVPQETTTSTTEETTSTTDVTTSTTEETTSITDVTTSTTEKTTSITDTTTSTTEKTTSITDITTSTTEETTIANITDSLIGDVNCNGSIKSNDLLMLKKYLLGLIELDTQSLKNADVNSDGNVKSNDLLMLKKFLLGLIELN